MNKRNKILLGGLIILGASIFLKKFRGSSPETLSRLKLNKIDTPAEHKNMRGKQYYEIFTAFKNFNNIIIGIYNNINRKDIPLEDWDNFDTEKIKTGEKAIAITKNGPRFWVMDLIRGYSSGEMRSFYGYEFDLVGVISDKASELKKQLRERSLYSERAISRNNDWIYNKGGKIYELISENGTVYTMQSASKEINKSQSVDDLESIGKNLKLPDGWKYNVKIADKDVCYETRGEAHIIQDDFLNTYQKNPVQS